MYYNNSQNTNDTFTIKQLKINLHKPERKNN